MGNILNPDFDVFTFGVPPVQIDLMSAVKGLDFDVAYKKSQVVDIEGLKIRLINYNDLVIAKKASGRPKDIDDIQNLT